MILRSSMPLVCASIVVFPPDVRRRRSPDGSAFYARRRGVGRAADCDFIRATDVCGKGKPGATVLTLLPRSIPRSRIARFDAGNDDIVSLGVELAVKCLA